MHAASPDIKTRAQIELPRLTADYPALFECGLRPHLFKLGVLVITLSLMIYALVKLDFSLLRILSGLERLGGFFALMFPPSSGGHALIYLESLGETLAIAYLGTLIAACFALPVGFLTARNIIPNIFVHFGLRRFLDTIRGVDTLIWALIWVGVVGLGPFAGVLAIACADFGALAKLFAEAIENADRKAVDGIASTGGSLPHEVRFGLLPQITPVLASQILYFIESNTRSATIIGIVGAGGIGLHLAEQIRVLDMPQVAYLVGLILVAVIVIDFISNRLRFAIIGRALTPH
jgi:phosphonate transport system permease protein